MKGWDRLLTIVVTATITSAGWILFGSTYTSTWLDEPDDAEPVATASRESDAVPGVGSALPDSIETPVIVEPGTGLAENLVVPVAGIRPDQLSDTFTDQRGGGSRLHEALDVMAPHGTPVVAAAPGTVERLFQSDAGGLTIYVRSPDRRTIYYYAHLASYAPGLEEGDTVSRGERLGTVGSTGNADPAAPHLHFAILRTTPEAEWYEPATALNPYPMLVGSGSSR